MSPVLASLLLAAGPALAPAQAKVTWTAPQPILVEGRPLPVRLEIEAPKGGASLPAWALEPAAFTIDGKPLGERRAQRDVDLAPGAKLVLELDLAPALLASKAFAGVAFDLGYARELGGSGEVAVEHFLPAASGLDFMKASDEEVARHRVLVQTSRGPMLFEVWPDVAPLHARNFLDLAASSFYDGTLFFRVGPGFMIQGGCPETKQADTARWGTGRGPRMLKAEFNPRKHERGVLSAARGEQPDSASCQFFVMHGAVPDLDGKYTAFGKLLLGEQALDAIANAKGTVLQDGSTFRPREPQRIESVTVVALPAKAGSKEKRKPESSGEDQR